MGLMDRLAERGDSLAGEAGCQAGNDWQKLIEREDVDAIVVATPHKYLAPITTAALNAGKYVFCEKPGARNATEAEIVLKAAYGSTPTRELGPAVAMTSQSYTRLYVGFT